MRPVDENAFPVNLIGAPYSVLKRKRILDDFDQNSGAATLSVPGEVNPIDFRWNSDNTVSFDEDGNATRISFQPKTGMFSGHFQQEGVRYAFRGICVQQPDAGEDIAAGIWNWYGVPRRVEIVRE